MFSLSQKRQRLPFIAYCILDGRGGWGVKIIKCLILFSASPPPPTFHFALPPLPTLFWWFSQWAISKFQNILLSNYEAKCKTILVKMSFICVKVKNHFHISGFPINLALKQRLEATLKLFIHVSPIFENFPFFTKITDVVGVLLTSSLTAFHWFNFIEFSNYLQILMFLQLHANVHLFHILEICILQ